MALWQYTFHIIPYSSSEKLRIGKQLESAEYFDDSEFWIPFNYKMEEFKDLEKILPLGKSWSEQITVYGNLETNCIEVISENDKVVSVSLRLDFRENYHPLLENVLTFLRQKNMLLIDESLIVRGNFLSELVDTINNSDQQKKYNKLSS